MDVNGSSRCGVGMSDRLAPELSRRPDIVVFGVDEEVLADIAYPNLEPEDGRIWIYDVDGEAMAFTPDAVESLRAIIADLSPHLLEN